MQPRVTVVLATVWLTVAVLVGGAVTLRLSHDQYSPVSPRRHARVQRDYTGIWKDHNPAEDQPFDLWISSRRSISTEGWQRRLPNIASAEFATDKVDYGYEMPETLSRETVVSSSDLSDDPFVADDTFQDQGPGSMEIYKLDLSKEKTLLTATTPSTNLLLSRNKSKAPKKTGHLNSKTKTTEIKLITTSANINHKQSNFFEEQRTETPLINKDAFDVGGVPELQVGCEGLEASLSSHKTKRSINTPDKEKGEVPASVLLNVSPVSLDLDDVLSYDEEEYEEMDELLKLKKLETTTKRNKPNRGDMDASHLNSDHLDEFRRPEKLPERGDLGGSILMMNSSKFITNQKTKRSMTDLGIKNYEEIKPKRETISLDDDNGASKSHDRQLLWLAKANTEGFADSRSERKRMRRSVDWGFGEDEGVVSSDELQTVNERRRQHEMRYHQNTSRRSDQNQGLNTDIDNIRQEYEKLLEQKRREEEYLRRVQQTNRRLPNKWEEEEKKRRDELWRRQYEEYRKRMSTSTPRMDNEDIRQMEERQKQEAARMQEIVRRNEEELRRQEARRLQEEEMKRSSQSKWQEENLKKSSSKTSVSDEEKKRRLHDKEIKRREEEQRRGLEEEEARRQEQYRSQKEAKKREEETRRQDSMRNLSEDDRRKLEDRRREWSEKKRQEDEDKRRRQQPSNLMHAEHSVSHPNDIRQRDRDEKKRQQEQKLREYIMRNRPINVNRADQKSEEEKRRYRPKEHQDSQMNMNKNNKEYHRRLEEQRKRQEEERKLQDYIKRNQPVNVPSRNNQSTAAGRNWFEERKLIEEARRRDRYPDPGVRRDHGPSAPTYIDPRSSPEEVRRRQQETTRRLEEEKRQRYEAEERRKELARRQWKEEEERRLRQERMREEAARREEEARREQSKRYEENRKQLEIARIQAEKRRQEMLKQRSRNEVGRTKQPEATRPIYYQDPRLLVEHRRRQDSQPIPSNLMRTEEARRTAAERQRQRLEAERRQQEESRMREHRQKETDQWRRQELARLNSLPVSAKIIVRPGSSPTSPISPSVISRDGFNNEIDFTGINPHREGVQVAQFPVPPTPRPPAQSPAPCVWAVVHCCSSNNNRLVKCFESLGCPGINWDPNPCRGPIADAAREEVLKFYANA